MPDVLLFFGVDLIPVGTSFTPSQLAVQPAIPGALARAAASFAALLDVAPANVYAVNISDRATGAWTSAGLRPVRIRRLQASPSKAPGGVTVTFVVRLGKVPTQASVMNMSAVLASPAANGALGVCASAVATAMGLTANSIVASTNSVALQYAPFSIAAGGGTTTIAGATTTTLSPGGIIGAAIGAVVVSVGLAIGIWARRSYAKHGKLPWTRNRKLELFARKSREAEVYEVESALAEAEKALEAREAAKFGGGTAGPKVKVKSKSKRDVIKALVESEAEAKRVAEEKDVEAKRVAEEKEREVAALRAQLKESKKQEDNDDEVAALKKQLADAKAWQEQMSAWAAAQQAAAAADHAQRAGFEPSQAQ